MTSIHSLVQEILKNGYLLSLATLDQQGVWVADVIYVHDDKFNLYFLSRTDRRHSLAIHNNSHVAGTITLSNSPEEKDKGIQLEGFARKIEGDILHIATAYALKRKKPVPTKDGEIFKPGQSWYCVQPKRIELIYEPLFGHEKQIVYL